MMRFWRQSLLARLLVYFLLLAVLPLATVGVLAYYQGQRTLQADILNHLNTTAILKEGEINRWVESMKQDTRLLAQNPLFRQNAERLLTQDEGSSELLAAHQALQSYLDAVLANKPDFLEILVLKGVGGKVLFSTNSQHEGNYEVTSSFFIEGRTRTYIQNVYLSASLGKLAMTVATPIHSESGQTVGVLAVHLNLSRLNEIMLQRTGLGATGETYLVDQYNVFVSEARFGGEGFPRGVHTQGIDTALLKREDGTGIYPNYRGVPVLGAYRWIDEREMALLAEIERSEALAPVRRLALAIFLIGLTAAGLVAAAAYAVARQISRPILALAETSTQMAAGDLNRTVEIHLEDEIGTLARAFNSMAAQLRTLITGLEQRVAERTAALEHRAVQLTTAADVGRAVVSILQPEALAREVVDLVRERFNLYYAGLFLLDETGEYAGLEAGTGEPGRLMKERGHKLQVGGKSMVGAACAQRRARIALDVGAEPVRFDNPLLPDTRSEMALPLMVGDRVLGALDVQSTQAAAFSDEDIAVLQLVADQVAVAMDNARKFSAEATLLEATSPLFRVSRRLSSAITTDEVVQATIATVAETQADGCGVARFDLGADGEVQTITFLGSWNRHRTPGFPVGRPLPASASMFPVPMLQRLWVIEDLLHDPTMPEDKRQMLLRFGARAMINIPLQSGTRPIGIVIVERIAPGPFSPVDIRLYETLASQAAVALERARLLEEAERRVEQERAIRDLADRVTASFDLDAILQTTLQDLSALVGAEGGYVELSVAGS